MSQIPLSLTIFSVYVHENCNPCQWTDWHCTYHEIFVPWRDSSAKKWLMIVMILCQLMIQASQPKRRAKVWDYVDSKVLDGRDKIICKYCKLHLYSIPRRCNSHLNRHIGFHCQNITQKDIDRFLAILKSLTKNKLYLTLLSSEVW